jgi:hypothetical protein
MKKFIALAIAVVALVAASARAQDADATTREGQRALVDTNATTTVTGYTATAIGQELVGAVGGSNAVWIALRTTATNWVKIAQDTSAR